MSAYKTILHPSHNLLKQTITGQSAVFKQQQAIKND